MTTKKDLILDTITPELIRAYRELDEEEKDELLDQIERLICTGKI